MRQLLLIIFCFALFALQAQNRKSSNKRAANVDLSQSTDSADIYYVLGWEAYKKGEFGDARYFWERSSGCASNSPSKYSSAFRLGLLHQTGEGIGVNYDVAFYYYNYAYANGQNVGNVDATKNVGTYYENGMCVQKDYKKALEWYQKAKQQGNKFCDQDITRVRQKIKEEGRK